MQTPQRSMQPHRRATRGTVPSAARLLGATLAAGAALMLAAPAAAATFRFANQGDVLSMDPHSLNETLQIAFDANIYEALVGRGRQLELVPQLATEWKQTAPNTWRFKLRKGVTFHDGTPFTADDVVFSWQRSHGDGSDMKTYVQAIDRIDVLDPLTIDIVTNSPFPILPDVLADFYIMSRKWCEANRATQPVDKRKGVENAASFKANGTGPYRLRERNPGVRTTLVRNDNYWGRIDGNVDEAIFTPIANPSTRVAALLSGEIEMMEPVPLQDVARINADAQLRVMQGPELRTIFLGMDQKRDALEYSDVKGRNPFRDKRVRQAFYQAIDVNAIQKVVMRGASTPSGLMIAPAVKGWSADLNGRLPYDVDAAKKLLSDAGYPQGFEVGLDCPNDRYVNDEEICKAVAAMLARINVHVQLNAVTKGIWLPKILARNTSFYMLGWTPSTVDAQDAINSLMTTPDDKSGRGQFNLGSWSNPRFDDLAAQIGSETDPAKRNAQIREAMAIHKDDVANIPLHQQALSWGVRRNVDLVQLATNRMYLKWVTVR